MNEVLKNVADHIKEKGLPSVESMRSDIDENERKNLITEKLEEYKTLFERFKAGEELGEDELRKMAGLSNELNKLSQEIQEA